MATVGVELLAVAGVLIVTVSFPHPSREARSQSAPAFRVGVTFGQYSIDPWSETAAQREAEGVLRSSVEIGNQHIMGWGALSPEPTPGEYDWSRLDSRVGTMRRTTDDMVITLCCAPDWMKGGRAGVSDWGNLEAAPLPEYFDSFAKLAAKIAARYPDVKTFQVWNELKGFWDPRANRWDIEGYTKLYNLVYRALKAVNPAIRVGGPYVPMDSWSHPGPEQARSGLSGPWGVVDQRSMDAVDYWLTHKEGADFIAVDGGSETKDRGLVTGDVQALDKFAAITRWLKSRTTLPIWWSEVYPAVDDADESPGSPRRAAVAADALVTIANAGAAVVIIWQPEESSLKSVALFESTTTEAGRPLPFARPLAWLKRCFAANCRPISRWTVTGVAISAGQDMVFVPSQ